MNRLELVTVHPPSGARAVPGVPVLGLDIGSTNVKAVLVRLDVVGRSVTDLAVRSAGTPDHPDALVAVVLDLVRAVLADGPAPQAVGIASMAETGAPLDRDGRPLTDLVRWDGQRGALDSDRLAAELGRAELFAATGVRPGPKAPLVTWAWLRRTQPAVWSRMARWGGAADLVCLAMTGALVTDHTLAGRTMAYRLPRAGEPLPHGFDPDLLAVVGVRPEQLPEVAQPGSAAGGVVGTEFVRAGLTAGTPVVVAGHDHAVGAWAAGARRPGDRADSIGTAEAVMTVLEGMVPRAVVGGHGMSLVRTVAGTHEAVLAGSPGAGAMVRWWSETVLGGESITAVLPTTAVAPTGLLVLPYPQGRQSPSPDPSARIRLLDEADREVDPASLREVDRASLRDGAGRAVAGRWTEALLEGLALQARWMLTEQHQLVADALGGTAARSPVHVLGGAARSNARWMALKAAVTPAPVRLVACEEPVASGAALLAAERLGLVPRATLRLPAVLLPRPPGSSGAFSRAYDRFVAAATSGAPR